MSSILCTEAKSFAAMLTSIKFIPFYMHSHVGIGITFVFVVVGAKVAYIPHSIMFRSPRFLKVFLQPLCIQGKVVMVL